MPRPGYYNEAESGNDENNSAQYYNNNREVNNQPKNPNNQPKDPGNQPRNPNRGNSKFSKVKGKIADAKNAVAELSKEFLAFCWENMLETFGATIILIDLYFIGHLSLGKKFLPKLGSEWANKLPGPANKALGDKLNMPETCACAGCNLGCFFIIIIAVVTFYYLMNPAKAAWDIGAMMWESVIKPWLGL